MCQQKSRGGRGGGTEGRGTERRWRSPVGEPRPTCDVLAQLVVVLTQRPQQLEDAVLLHQGQLVVRAVVDEVAHGARGVALHLLVGMVEELHQPGHSLEAAGLRTGMWALVHVCTRHRCAQMCASRPETCAGLCARVPACTGRCAEVCRCICPNANHLLLPLLCWGGAGPDGVCPVSVGVSERWSGTGDQ